MKTETLRTAIKLGFNFDDADFETREQFEQIVVDFLSENTSKLPKLKEYCEVTNNGRGQSVEHKGYSSSGDIMHYDNYSRKHRVYHSNYLHIDEATGKCFEMNCD